MAQSPDVRQQVGNKLRELRRSRKLSQDELASRAAIDRAYYGRIERGEASVGIVKLERLAKELKVKIRDLF